MFSNALPFDELSVKRGIEASRRVVSHMNEAPLELAFGDTVHQFSPSPFVISPDTMSQYIDIHEALVEALHAAVSQWYRDTKLQKIFNLHPRIASSLQLLAETNYKMGCIRPDMLIRNDGKLMVCEINARFPLNGFYLTTHVCDAFHRETMNPDSIYARLGLLAVSSTSRCSKAIKDKLTDENVDTIWIINVNEKLYDAEIVEHSTSTKFRECHPERLRCNGSPFDGLFFEEDDHSLTEIRSCITLLHQHEYLLMDDKIIQALTLLSSKGRALNDLRTTFLVHDKRMLHVIQSDMLDLKKSTRDILAKHIIPTIPALNLRNDTSMMKSASLVLKPCLLGKGKGIMMEKNFDSRISFLKYLDEVTADSEYVVQPYQQQEQFEIINNQGVVRKMSVVASLLSLDSSFYGPAIFRCNDSDLVAIASGGCPSYALWKVKEIPATVRSFTPTLRNANFPKIIDSIVRDGLALVGVKEPLGCKNALRYFLEIGIGAKTRRHSDIEGDVWDVKPKVGWTKSDARSHTSNAFEIHTDASFEAKPPRFVAMTVIHADRMGGGFFSLMNISDVVRVLTKEEVNVLKTLKPKWKVPPEFKKATGEDMIGPVLLSENRARFRKDIVMTDHMKETDKKRFWKAFDKFCNILEEKCNKSKLLLPEQSVIIFDNQRFAHARTAVRDMSRHLQRVRFDLPNLENELVN